MAHMVIAAPNGARRGKADHPGLPVTVSEIARESCRCLKGGAAVLHLHVRTDEGTHSLDPGRYREAITRIGDVAPGLIVQITTEAAGMFGLEEQIACVKAVRPESVSVAWREFCPEENQSARRFYDWAASVGIHVQHILYDPDDVRRFKNFGLKNASVLLVLGNHSGQAGAPDMLENYLAALGDVRDWCVCAFGRAEHEVVAAALEAGGHVRVGFENDLRRSDGSLAAGTYELVEQIKGEKMKPADVRVMWKLAANG